MRYHHGVSAAAIILACGTAQAQSINILSPLPGGTGAQAWGISRNGQWVVGQSGDASSAGTVATRWSGEGPVPLNFYGTFNNIAYAVADSGQPVVGEGDGQAVLWGEGYGGDTLLGPGAALDISANGAVSVGYRNPSNTFRGFRYSGGVTSTYLPAAGDTASEAGAVVTPPRVAGTTSRMVSGSVRSNAAVWTAPGVPSSVLPNPPGFIVGVAQDISADGTVVVGLTACCDESPAQACRWVNGVPTALTDTFGNAYACSDDGNIVVGENFDGAFVWTPAVGFRSIRQILIDANVDMTDIFLIAARDISADGAKIVGWGFGFGEEIAWVVDLTPTGPACDPDVNCDGNADQDDVACLIDAVAGNPGCECQDPDFNQDGNVDQDDVAALINVVAGGDCP